MSIDVRDLTLQIGEKTVCRNLSLTFSHGERWAILGVNGVGKSTLLHALIDTQAESASHIFIDGLCLSDYKAHRRTLAQKTGLLLQEYSYSFPCTVLEAVMIGRHPYNTSWVGDSKEDEHIAQNALRQTGIGHLRNRYVDTLSGGEKRRMNLATLLTQSPDYMLLDEPTNHLDLHAQVEMLELITTISTDANQAAIMVMHDANLARRYCDKALMLFGEGKCLAGDVSEIIQAEQLQQLYGCEIHTYEVQGRQVFLPI
ncbi:MAG: ABC transporter ATP-binding protein [Gammaproteobacteria bacterium]|nr:ABC transporter ATP-binding protein [Gammaproteobacteria bacterium]